MRLVPLAAAAALAAGALAATTAATAHPSAGAVTGRVAHTHRVVVRPVDSAGDPVAGWTVKRERGFSVDCGGSAPAAVDDGIAECFPTAVYLPACWKSTHHTALCLRDARVQKLVRVRYNGAFGSPTAPKRPTPQDLDLVKGQQCSIRIGGAWGILPSHPTWSGFYSCTKGSVYGPSNGDGVNRSHPVWTVHVWKSGTKDTVVTRGVRTAYFVGTAS